MHCCCTLILKLVLTLFTLVTLYCTNCLDYYVLKTITEYNLQWTVRWARAWAFWVTLFFVVHLICRPLKFLVIFLMIKVSPRCKTVLFPSWVQMMCEGGLLVALQKKVTVSYSTTVLLFGEETMTAASATGKGKLIRTLLQTHCNLKISKWNHAD